MYLRIASAYDIGNDNSIQLKSFDVWGVVKLFWYKEIRQHKEIYRSNSRDCGTSVVSLRVILLNFWITSVGVGKWTDTISR